MKVNEFIIKLKEIANQPSLYGWGCFGNKMKYNKYYLYDCSGLIKGVLWGYPKSGTYRGNGVPDVNADTMITKYCTDVSTSMSNIEVGEVVWLKGHIGVYIGNGYVIESTPIWADGVQTTKLTQRKWQKHGKLVWLDYSKQTSPVSIIYIARCVVRGDFGNGHTKRKNAIAKLYPNVNYEDVRKKVNEYYANGGKW